jgi:hypothetical protein
MSAPNRNSYRICYQVGLFYVMLQLPRCQTFLKNFNKYKIARKITMEECVLI